LLIRDFNALLLTKITVRLYLIFTLCLILRRIDG